MSKQTRLIAILASVIIAVAFVAPVVVAQGGGRTAAPALPFPGEPQQEATSDTGGIAILSAGTSGISGAANWLLTQQDVSGGFPWTPGGALTSNTQGPTGQGPLKAYQHDGDSAYLNSAIATGNYLVPNYPRTYSDGDPRFATHDPLFLEDLSLVTGDATYADFTQANFWDKLAAGTYGEGNDMDAAAFGAAVVSGRAGQGIVELSPWDLSATAIAAHMAGETAIRDDLMNAILDGLEATTIAGGYDVIGLAGAVWASAVTGVDLDPAAGIYASADTTADLAVILAGMTTTANDGAWLWSSTADPGDATNGDTQTTAYAVIALNAHDRSTYLGQIARGVAFIRSLQQSSGQFLAYPTASPSASGSVEVHAEALTALVTVAPDAVCVDDDFAGSNFGDAVSGAGCGMGTLTFGYDAFDNLRSGIDGVGNSTVNVASGTYYESITFDAGFDKDNLTISGNASNRPVVTGGVHFAQTATLDGLTLENLYIKGVASGGNGVVDMDNSGVINDFAMNNCVIDGENVSGRHGFLGQNLGQSFAITNTEFKDILGWAVMDIDSGSGDGGNGQLLTTVTFANNNIHDSNGSVALRGNAADRTNAVNVYGNTWNDIGGNGGETGEHWAAVEINHADTANVYENIVYGVQQGAYGEGQALQLWDVGILDLHNNDFTGNAQGIFVYGGSTGGGYGGPYAVPGGSIYDNRIAGNADYGINVDPVATGGPLDASGNAWGTNTPGDVAAQVSANVDYTPWLDTDTDIDPGTPGFQGDFSTLHVDDDSPQSGSASYVQEGIDLVTASTVIVHPGLYPGSLTIAKPLTLACANAGVPVTGRTAGSASESIIDLSGNASGIVINSGGVTVDGCDIVGDADTNHGIYIAAGSNSLSSFSVANNFIHGMALENSSNDSVYSYGILADAKASAVGPFGLISDLVIEGNKIYAIGGAAMPAGNLPGGTTPAVSGGLGISLHEIDGANAGDGATITGNIFETIHDGLSGSDPAFGTAVSIAESGLGPSSGASVTGNKYADTTIGLFIFANTSSVSEANGDFSNVPVLVLNGSGLATIDEPALVPYAHSNLLTDLEPTLPGSEGYFVKIQTAIDASDPGASVTVTNGIFRENVVVDKSLTLQAKEGHNPIIDGDTDLDTIPDGSVITIAANEVVIDGFEIRNGYNGITGETSASAIQNNVIHDNLNIPGSAGVGVLLWGENDQNAIGGNEIFHNDRQGIFIGFSDDSKVSNNNSITNNRIYSNGLYREANGPDESEYGIQLWNADGSIINYNEIFDHHDWYFGQGIYLTASDGNAIFDNDIYDNNYGVSVYLSSSDTYLAGNIIHDNAVNGLTIFDEGSASTLVNFNQFCRNAEYGVQHAGFGNNVAEIDATYNWWGSASGPGPVGPGTGDHVSEGVVFLPWNTIPPTDGPCHINSIHVQKYEDVDGSGDKSDDEPGLNDWVMTLYDDQGQEVMSDSTHTVGYEDGWVFFEDLPSGEYTVCETVKPGGWANSDPGSDPPCKSITVTDGSLGPGPGPLFTFIDHPGNDEYRFTLLGVNIWALASMDLGSADLGSIDLGSIDLTEESLRSQLSEPWLCVLDRLTLDPDVEVNPEELLDLPGIIEWDVSEGFDNGLFYLTLESDYLEGPLGLGIKTWRGSGGYSTATGFIGCGSGPTVLFGNYRRGSITIIKEANKKAHTWEFTGDLGDFTLASSGSQTFSDLASNTYTVAEVPTSFPDQYWALLNVTCVDEESQPVEGVVADLDNFSADIPLKPGQHLTCTFFNERADLEEEIHRQYLPLVLKK